MSTYLVNEEKIVNAIKEGREARMAMLLVVRCEKQRQTHEMWEIEEVVQFDEDGYELEPDEIDRDKKILMSRIKLLDQYEISLIIGELQVKEIAKLERKKNK